MGYRISVTHLSVTRERHKLMWNRLGLILAMAAAAATSQATITFNFGGDSRFSEQGTGLAVMHDNTAEISGVQTTTLTGSFDVYSTTFFTDIVTDVLVSPNNSSAFANSFISFDATLSGFGSVYHDHVDGTDEGPGLPNGGTVNLTSAASNHFTVNFSTVLRGTSADAYAILGDVNFLFHESASTPPPPVPEPASLAALGFGLVAFARSRRKGTK